MLEDARGECDVPPEASLELLRALVEERVWQSNGEIFYAGKRAFMT